MEGLSKEYVIQKVEEHKVLIKSATDRLSDILYKFRKENPKDFELTDEYSLEVRKVVHEIVSELSMIGGFCDSWSRDYIDKTVTIVAGFTSKSKISVFSSYS